MAKGKSVEGQALRCESTAFRGSKSLGRRLCDGHNEHQTQHAMNEEPYYTEAELQAAGISCKANDNVAVASYWCIKEGKLKFAWYWEKTERFQDVCELPERQAKFDFSIHKFVPVHTGQNTP